MSKTRRRDDPFEAAMIRELRDLQTLVLQRRDRAIVDVPSPTAMGRVFALGAVDALIWRLLQRARGITGVD